MRKLLLSSIVLFLFSASILMFQMSCKKEAKADNPIVTQSDGLKQLGKILYYSRGDGGFWLMNYDGTDKKKLNIILPSGETDFGEAKLSPDGQTLFFTAWHPVMTSEKDITSIYSCKLDGSGLTKLLKGETSYWMQGVY